MKVLMCDTHVGSMQAVEIAADWLVPGQTKVP